MLAALSASLMLALSGAAESSSRDGFVFDETSIFVTTTTFGGDHRLLAMERSAPWGAVTLALLDSPDAVVQSFAGLVLVVEPSTDRVRVFDGAGAEIRSIPVGEGTRPRDVLGVARNRAYVTRADSAFLYRIDPQTGAGAPVVDLGPVAGADGIPDMERMVRIGSTLFVQLRRLEDGLPTTDGAIAVVDLDTETLVDVNPATPEVDAIELEGPAPRLRMHVDPAGAFLLVSATDGNHLSFNGGLELIDLATLTSDGLLLREIDLAALGGFVMTAPSAGYYLAHTDIIPSNHLNTFSIEHGATIGQDIVFDGGAYLDALLFDAESGLVYMPSSAGGMYVVDAALEEPVMVAPIPLPGMPMDQVIGPVGHRFDLTGDDAVGFADLLLVLAAWGDCPATPSCPDASSPCVPDIAGADGAAGFDCVVDLKDLLLLLSNWGT